MYFVGTAWNSHPLDEKMRRFNSLSHEQRIQHAHIAPSYRVPSLLPDVVATQPFVDAFFLRVRTHNGRSRLASTESEFMTLIFWCLWQHNWCSKNMFESINGAATSWKAAWMVSRPSFQKSKKEVLVGDFTLYIWVHMATTILRWGAPWRYCGNQLHIHQIYAPKPYSKIVRRGPLDQLWY